MERDMNTPLNVGAQTAIPLKQKKPCVRQVWKLDARHGRSRSRQRVMGVRDCRVEARNEYWYYRHCFKGKESANGSNGSVPCSKDGKCKKELPFLPIVPIACIAESIT